MRLRLRHLAAFAAALLGLAGAEASASAVRASGAEARAAAISPTAGDAAGAASVPETPPPAASGRETPRAILRAAAVGGSGPLSSPAPAAPGNERAAASGARTGAPAPAGEAPAAFWDGAHAHPAQAP